MLPNKAVERTRVTADGFSSAEVRADAELVAEPRRFARDEGFDEQPMPGLDSEALDLRVASESFAAFRKLARRDLETLRLVTDHQGRKVPTAGGMVLFGTDRERHFPDAWIQAGRFQGTDKSRIVDRVEIRSLPVRAIEEAIPFVHQHAVQGTEIGAVRRKERWNLPPAAVREASINAVTHIDYAYRGAPLRLSTFDDRLEVEKPGLLPFGLTLEDSPRGAAGSTTAVLPGRSRTAMKLTLQQLEAHLWGAANILRGKTAGQDYKNYILSLMFYKRLCDQWEREAGDAIADQERQQGRAFSEQEIAVFRRLHEWPEPAIGGALRLLPSAGELARPVALLPGSV